MKIKELLGVMYKLDSIEGKILTIGDVRTVNLKTGGQAQVVDCTLEDDTAQIKLTLWDEQIKMVKEGSEVTIENGYTTKFKDELGLNVGKYGKLVVRSF